MLYFAGVVYKTRWLLKKKVVEKVAVEEEVVRDLKGSEKKTVHSLFLLL
jgi:hypothetical protein